MPSLAPFIRHARLVCGMVALPLAVCAWGADELPPSAYDLTSPDGAVAVHVEVKTVGKEAGVPVYSLAYRGRPVLVESRLGLSERSFQMSHDFVVEDRQTRSQDTTWKPLTGERAEVRDHCNELALRLRTTNQPNARRRSLTLTFRAYDQGLAFAYTLNPENPAVCEILKEETQFAFPGNPTLWTVNFAQADYTKSARPMDKEPSGVEWERPLTVRLDDGLWAAVSEARVADYARTRLTRVANTSTLATLLDGSRFNKENLVAGSVLARVPFTTPWRIVMVGDSPAKLLESNDLHLNLNDPCAIADTTWIKPGKVLRDTTLSTVGAKACIDFAQRQGLQHILFDAGWYGPENDLESDARQVYPKLQGTLDMEAVIAYGKERGIGVILYINHVAMERQFDAVLPIYERWGIAGVKFGFVNCGSQYWNSYTHECVRKCAAHHLMVDIHDEFRDFGYRRTYPNLMTVEGIHGDEGRPSDIHNATLPFTRMLCGPADHTYCWAGKALVNSKAHQLALSTILFSPWSCLYWYDKPQEITEEPALAYWKALPTTWDDTRVLAGDPGRRVVVARRSGESWFLGAIDTTPGKLPITLDFLPEGRTYSATLYADGADLTTVRIETRAVKHGDVIDADIHEHGGLAVHIQP